MSEALTPDEAIAEMNGKYFVVNERGKTVVYSAVFDHSIRRKVIVRSSFEDIKNLYGHRMVRTGVDEQGNATYKPLGNFWLKHPKRRSYAGGVTFDPTGSHEPGVYNTWQGYGVRAVKGDWSLLRDHCLENLCKGDRTHFAYLMKWSARVVQHPDTPGDVAVVLRGGEGTGKGTFANALTHIMGSHGAAIQNAKHLVGNFNSHLKDIVLLFADEAFFAGDKSHTGVLKALISERTLMTEAKYQNSSSSPNFLHILMASNEQWVVPASLDSRRFFVLDVGNKRKRDNVFFNALLAQMRNGGFEALLHDLLAMDISDFDIYDVPVTEGLHAQRHLSVNCLQSWWIDCLQRGYVTHSSNFDDDSWSAWVPSDAAYQNLLDFAKFRNERRMPDRSTFGKFLSSMGAVSRRATAQESQSLSVKKQAQGYSMDDLSSMRMKFHEETGLVVAWDEEPEATSALDEEFATLMNL